MYAVVAIAESYLYLFATDNSQRWCPITILMLRAMVRDRNYSSSSLGHVRLQPPGRIAPVFASVKQAKDIAVRIA